MALTILDIAAANGVKERDDGSITAGAFEDLGLPFFAGCQCCGAQLAPYNAYPSRAGFIRCRHCVGEIGFETSPNSTTIALVKGEP